MMELTTKQKTDMNLSALGIVDLRLKMRIRYFGNVCWTKFVGGWKTVATGKFSCIAQPGGYK